MFSMSDIMASDNKANDTIVSNTNANDIVVSNTNTNDTRTSGTVASNIVASNINISDIKIVEYNPSYARAVADMWNRSADGWNGAIMNRTEETVMHEHENASHLNVFLAVKGDEVIGYCSLDEYTQDEGALYVNTLNVRPDYHGKKVGKLLVLTAVNKTIELGWPRLDLYTWPGNTKAVPLYKKCGFFWEKRDNTTHLMNFIPTVLKTEAISSFFETADWYEDSTRIIEIKPDGRKENKFDYFEYSWEKNGRKLRVEFERTGRDMRLIETDDYLVSMTILQEHELVFGRTYKAAFDVANKSGKPLNVAIKGINDKNISFDFEKQVNICEKNHQAVEADFHVGEIEAEQNPGKTHPGVAAEILINGRKAFFKVGILPVYPAKLNLLIPNNECYIGTRSECFMEIENKFNEDAVFEIDIPEMDGISFEQCKYEIELKGSKRDPLPVPYILDKYVYYSANIPVTAYLKNCETIRFSKKINSAFRGRDGIMWGEAEDFCEILNGPYSAWFNKQNNCLWLGRLYGDSSSTFWIYPKLGKPFSSELSKKKPDSIQCYREGDIAVLKALYDLKDFKGLQLTSICELSSSGIIRHYYEIKNCHDNETAEDVWLSDSFRHDLYRGVIPYEGKFIEIDDTAEGILNYWNSEKITENWLFSYGEKLTRGIFWDKNEKIKFDNWCMFFEHNLGKLPPGACARTKPVTVVLGAFNDWHDFREFALKKTIHDKPVLTNHIDISVNDGNPFAGGKFRINVKDFKNKSISGEITVRSGSKAFQEQVHKLEPDSAGDTCELLFDISAGTGANVNPDINSNINSDINSNIDSSTSSGINSGINPGINPDIIHIDFDTGAYAFSRKIAAFFKAHGDVQTGKLTENSCSVLTACNGLLSIKASPDFSYALHSLKYKVSEWLDSSFPAPGMKAWWNPWLGGIDFLMSGISTASLLEEARYAGFVELEDVLGNKWKGIRKVINIEKNELYRGMKIGLYYMMLPGAPVLCCVTGVVQETGRYLNQVWLINQLFFKPSEDIKESWVAFKNGKNELLKLKAGQEQHFINPASTPMYGSSSRNEKLHVFTDANMAKIEAGVNTKLVMAEVYYRSRIKNGEKIFTQPIFLVFSDDYLPHDALKDLNNVKFDPKELKI